MHDVFISYANKNKPTADAVCAKLEAEGIRCWIAPRDVLAGTEWAGAIIQAIKQARVMVLVLSVDSNCSKQVMREVGHAVTAGLIVIPFRIEDVTLSESMEYYLSAPHWLDALTPPLEEHLQRLCEAVRQNLSSVGTSQSELPRSGLDGASSSGRTFDSAEMQLQHESKTWERLVSSRSYGLRALDGEGRDFFSPVITKNEPIPAEVKRTFGLAQDGQTEISLSLYEYSGDHSNVELNDTTKLGDVILTLPQGLPTGHIVDIYFVVSRSGTLEIRAQTECNGRTVVVGPFQVSGDNSRSP